MNFFPWDTSRLLVRAAIVMVMMHASIEVHAHLLNMTEVELRANDTQHLELSLAFDASRYFDGRLTYYKASKQNDPLNNPQITAIVQQALGAIALMVQNNGATLTGVGKATQWQVHSIKFDQLGRAEYLDPLQWPLIRVQASLELDKPANAISAKFTPDFIFEEPISLTLVSIERDKSMTRWLITQQSSPLFTISTTAQNQVISPAGENENGLYFYFRQGFLHILPWGYDHLLFVLAILVTSISSRQLITSLTVFTLAHSITLIISLFGIVRLPSNIVEPLIALSIAWVALESVLFKVNVRWRYVVIFSFGLLHGMGFASAISSLGLPAVGTLLSLLVFNLGIEAGQLMFVFAVWLLAHIMTRHSSDLIFGWHNDQKWRVPVALFLGSIGLLWAILRVIS